MFLSDRKHGLLPDRRFGQAIALVAAIGLADGLFATYSNSSIATDLLDRFALFTNCRSIGLAIEPLNDDEKLELQDLTVQRAIESRLRSARIYDSAWHLDNPDGRPYLSVFITFTNTAFAIEMSFHKIVFDAESAWSNYAPTWRSARVTGTHGRDADFVLSKLARLTDEFLVEYLRVNEESCESH